MKIKGTCLFCTREFLVDQLFENGGHCPWCGKSFQKDYAAVMVDQLKMAQSAGETLENALEKLAELHPWFELDRDSVLSEIDGYLGALSGGSRPG
ncbi:MAG: hypothetical protein WD757_01155 [Actinomycetota bacterium]